MTRTEFIAHIEHKGFRGHKTIWHKQMADGTNYVYKCGKLKAWFMVKFPRGWLLIEHAYYKDIIPRTGGYRDKGWTDGKMKNMGSTLEL